LKTEGHSWGPSLVRGVFDRDTILSQFQNPYWIDHNWSFGMHDKYFYTLPFQYDDFPGYFKGFDDIKSNKPEIFIDNP
jgi:hypothetical protein